ncbi:protein kinase domain-containing protein [Moorena producens]|uniref:serine/threonine protein kinase n=1 Tax=Moorena producens TaxID=1155739 RepID=UPI003C729A56
MNNCLEFKIHGYQIIRELTCNQAVGKHTYLAINLKTKQYVVIKQFQVIQTNTNWLNYDTYEREIQVLKGLEHPGIPCYLDSFQTEDGFCLVQEYKEASSLAKPRSFSPDDIKRIAISLLEIFVYLQNRIPSVIHRDVQPANILVDDDLNVYLIDFGFARLGDGEVGVSSLVKGTLGFMPPEQLFRRQLTEASDLYSVGITLICLLSNTKAEDIDDLVDIRYQVNFQHLIPKVSPHWVKWLEKMVEPQLENRYPNARAALAAIPTDPICLPKVDLSHSSLEFTGTSLGKKLTHSIWIKNPIPETTLTGKWEVAPHLHDPPHTPDYHSWISFEPATFEGNQVECKITIDTGKLMADKTYYRQVLLQTNSSPKTYSLDINLKTAPIPITRKKLPYPYLALLLLFAVAVDWIIASSLLIYGTLMGISATPGFSTLAGAAVGLELAAWLTTTAGRTSGAMAGGTAGILVGIVTWVTALTGLVATAEATTVVGAVAGLVGGLISGVAIGIVVEKFMDRGLTRNFSIWLSLVSTAFGSSLGLIFILGLLDPLVPAAVVVTGIPLVAMITYIPLQRARKIAEYRQAERKLIQP